MKMFKSIALLGILIIGLGGSVQAATTYNLDITLITGVMGETNYDDLAPGSQIDSVSFVIGGLYTPNLDGTIIPGEWDRTTYLTGNPVTDLGTSGVSNDLLATDPNPILNNGRIFSITSDFAPTNLSFRDFDWGYLFADTNGDGVYDEAFGLRPDPIDPTIIELGTIPGRYFTASFQAVPIPAAAWLLGSGLLGLVALKRRKSS